MRVVFIEEEGIYNLQKAVNNELSKHENEDIIDIKYNGSEQITSYGNIRYSVMIILK